MNKGNHKGVERELKEEAEIKPCYRIRRRRKRERKDNNNKQTN